MAFKRAQIKILGGVAGAHGAALAGADLLETDASDVGVLGEQRPLRRALLDRAVDVAGRQSVAGFDPRVEKFERAAGGIAGFGRAFQRHVVAVGVGNDAEAAFDLGEVLVELAEDERGEAIVGEGEARLDGVRPHAAPHLIRARRGRAGRAHAAIVARAGAAITHANSELAPAATISTGTTRPMRSGDASACTCWR